jgi:hypothetical protein
MFHDNVYEYTRPAAAWLRLPVNGGLGGAAFVSAVHPAGAARDGGREGAGVTSGGFARAGHRLGGTFPQISHGVTSLISFKSSVITLNHERPLKEAGWHDWATSYIAVLLADRFDSNIEPLPTASLLALAESRPCVHGQMLADEGDESETHGDGCAQVMVVPR